MGAFVFECYNGSMTDGGADKKNKEDQTSEIDVSGDDSSQHFNPPIRPHKEKTPVPQSGISPEEPKKSRDPAEDLFDALLNSKKKDHRTPSGVKRANYSPPQQSWSESFKNLLPKKKLPIKSIIILLIFAALSWSSYLIYINFKPAVDKNPKSEVVETPPKKTSQPPSSPIGVQKFKAPKLRTQAPPKKVPQKDRIDVEEQNRRREEKRRAEEDREDSRDHREELPPREELTEEHEEQRPLRPQYDEFEDEDDGFVEEAPQEDEDIDETEFGDDNFDF